MPLELIVERPRKVAFREYTDPPLTDDQVLVRTTVSGIKSGTEINLYRGENPFVAEVWDPALRLFRPPEKGEIVKPFFPHGLGSWATGVVAAVGPKVVRLRPGDRVHGDWKHRQTAILPEARLYPVESQEQGELMLFTDPAKFALAAVHDAEIKLADRVAIFGMGAIGLLAVQMARLDGASQVFAVDPIQGRLELARRLGADVALNPGDCDAALSIKRSTGGKGVDVVYDSVGKISAEASLASLRPRGWFITYGNASGAADPIPPGRLAAGGSLVMTRPTLFNFTDTPASLVRASKRLFSLVETGVLSADIGQRFALKDAADAHRALESGKTSGAILLMP